ncbi:UNVERIFIED_CONTAM: hypothetical protein Sangu_2646500 [Sesamum angustifolium]|uniref:Uncharacterized protein n=1 Tax=Sesamum angustifolium TaxID=2727405 RepID=A0AAW2J368_9LAMI
MSTPRGRTWGRTLPWEVGGLFTRWGGISPLRATCSWGVLSKSSQSLVGIVTTTVKMYSLKRYATDNIGVWDDVIEMKVEDIALFHGNQPGNRDECSNVIDNNNTRAEKRQRNN